ncbi:MAG: hypothetical protein NDJ92_04315 [Thermoanaerobaculia bacterium]|nr:hypothetical protein [Thermoanaerobaculia bacterium]
MTTITTCYHCQSPYDALVASWCDCPVGDPTLVCPSCTSCFCLATTGYKEGFWQVAPDELWRRRAERDATADELVPGATPLSRPVVLVICSDLAERVETKRVLGGLGCGLVFAATVDQSLELARKFRPALLIADDRVDDLEGSRFARALRTETGLAGTKIALLSSLYRTASQREEALSRLAVDRILTRPLVADEAGHLIEALLS